MEKELKIKHLSPYLPYGLMCQIKNGNEIIEDCLQAIYNSTEGCECVFYNIVEAQQGFEFVKPLLRRKPHLHNLQSEILIRWGGGLSDSAKAQWLKEITDDMLYSAFNLLRYDFVLFMLENHIDVFGLIDAGLAVEIENN